MKTSRASLKVVILIASVLSAGAIVVVRYVNKQETETHWSAYQDNGDKPGVEFVITESVKGSSGWLVVHDANDNRVLERFPMQVKRITSDEYMVVVTIRGSIKKFSVRYSESADGMTRMATIRNPDASNDSDSPSVVSFTKSTTR
jgi:hypothetical protein